MEKENKPIPSVEQSLKYLAWDVKTACNKICQYIDWQMSKDKYRPPQQQGHRNNNENDIPF